MKQATIAYHGTRIDAETIQHEGLKAPGCVNVKNIIDDALDHFGIPLEKALDNALFRNEYETTTQGRVKCVEWVWVSTEKENCCYYAKTGPERLSLPLSHLGVSIEEIKNYADLKFGTPKCVTIKVPDGITIFEGDTNEPLPNIPPDKIVSIEPCRVS